MSEMIKVKGRFRKVLAGGPDKDWAYAFCSFYSDKQIKYNIYMTKTKIEIDNYYEVDLIYQERKQSYLLKNLSISKPEEKNEVKNIILNNVDGIGLATLEKIENKYGEKIWETILEEPEKTQSILSEKLFNNLKEFCNIYSNNNYSFFVENNLTIFHNKLIQKFGKQDFIDLFKKTDPYSLYIDHGFNIEEVDYFAQKLNPDLPLNLRARAYILAAFNALFDSNNTKLDITKIIEKASLLFHEKINNFTYTINDFALTLRDMINAKEIYFDKKLNKVSLISMMEKEKLIADKLFELNKKDENNYKIVDSDTFSLKQFLAYKLALENNVSIITGYPGTGKSFIISHIINTLIESKKYKLNDIALLAPTGRAATILSEKCDKEAKTIHSFLKISKDDFLIEAFEHNTMAKVIIIDEFSMVNTNIFYYVMSMCKNVEKIILIGDENQLPCIGPGNLLQDLIDSNKFVVTRLTDIYRTDKKDLFQHFLDINNNKLPELETDHIHTYEWSILDFVKKVTNLYEDKITKYSIDNTIILLPSYYGEAGINKINKILQKWNIKYFGLTSSISINLKNESLLFYKGDRVIQLVNDYEKNVFNGELGFIKDIDFSANQIFVDFNGKVIQYNKNEILENLKLAYAITVHKFQGSECSCVIFGIFRNQAEHMLTRKLIYTAVSRAKDELILVGSPTLYKEKISNKDKEKQIYTNFKDFLEEE